MRNIFKFLHRFFATEPFTKLVQAELFPGDGVNSDEEIDAYLRHSMMTGAHPTSSCAMGTDSGNSVVDAQLKVHGIVEIRQFRCQRQQWGDNENYLMPFFPLSGVTFRQ